MRYIHISDAKPGMILASTLYDNAARILLSANTKLTKTYIARIERLCFDKICVYDNADETRCNQLLDDDIRRSALYHLKKLNIDDCLYIANAITNAVISNPDYIYELQTVSSYDNRTFDHSINVAILATMIGVAMGFDNEHLKKLSQGGLLHDIGKSQIPLEIINKEGPLTDEEYELVKQHPKYGLLILRNNCLISSTVRYIVYSHHENENGTGYPRGLKGKDIHIFAKIVHVADVYDAMVSKRSYKDSMAITKVLEYMQSNINTLFNANVVNALFKCVDPNCDVAVA